MEQDSSKSSPKDVREIRNKEWRRYIPLYSQYKIELSPPETNLPPPMVAPEAPLTHAKTRLNLDIELLAPTKENKEKRAEIRKHMYLLIGSKKEFYYNDGYVMLYHLLLPLLPTPDDAYIVMRHLTDTYMSEYCRDYSYIKKYPISKVNSIISRYSSFSPLKVSHFLDPIMYPFLCGYDGFDFKTGFSGTQAPLTTASAAKIFDWIMRASNPSHLHYLTASFIIERLSNRCSDHALASALPLNELESVLTKAEWFIMIDFWRPILYLTMAILFLVGIFFVAIKLFNKVDHLHVDEFGNSTNESSRKHF